MDHLDCVRFQRPRHDPGSIAKHHRQLAVDPAGNDLPCGLFVHDGLETVVVGHDETNADLRFHDFFLFVTNSSIAVAIFVISFLRR